MRLMYIRELQFKLLELFRTFYWQTVILLEKWSIVGKFDQMINFDKIVDEIGINLGAANQFENSQLTESPFGKKITCDLRAIFQLKRF